MQCLLLKKAMDQENRNKQESKMPPAETGNASNPSPHNDRLEPAANNSQLLNERAEKYLRESASPEDYPDEQDWEDADKVLRSDNDGK